MNSKKSTKTTAQRATRKVTSTSASAESSDLSQVRDILFGEDVQRLDRERELLHKQMEKDLTALAAKIQRNSDKQAEKMQTIVQGLREELRMERTERNKQHAELLSQVKEMTASLENRMTDRTSLAQMLSEVATHLDQDKKAG